MIARLLWWFLSCSSGGCKSKKMLPTYPPDIPRRKTVARFQQRPGSDGCEQWHSWHGGAFHSFWDESIVPAAMPLFIGAFELNVFDLGS